MVATRTPSKLQNILKTLKHPELVEVVSCDVYKDKSLVSSLVAQSTAVCSILPVDSHLPVMEACIANGVSAVTPSTISDAVASLDSPAKKAGVLLLKEVGQSPGMDHVETMRLAAKVKEVGGKVRAYTSLTGSLAPVEGLDNPLQMKLTWGPKSWLMHTWNNARYLENGSIVDVPWNELFLPKNLGTDHYKGLGNVSWVLDRDAAMYTKLYALNDVVTAKRGIHDYPKAMPFLLVLQSLGLTSLNAVNGISDLTYLQFLQSILGVNTTRGVMDAICAILENNESDGVDANEMLNMMDHIGLLSNTDKVPCGPSSPLDVISVALDKVTIQPGEPDTAINKQIMQIEREDGLWEEWQSSLEIDGTYLGIEDDSAASKATALPIVVALKLILEKKLPADIVGVQRPISPEIYNPIHQGLGEYGLHCQWTVKDIPC